MSSPGRFEKTLLIMLNCPGWHKFIAEYIEKIEALGAVNYEVSEKYGELCFKYIEYTPDADINEIQRLVEEAETRSESICQKCGGFGQEVEVNTWVRTLCKLCYVKIYEEANPSEK